MQHKNIEYFDGSQKLIGQLIFDENQSKNQKPAILIFPALEGRDSFIINYAEKLAQHGYPCFAADMYGDARVGDSLDQCFELINPFLKERSLVRRRALSAFSTLQGLKLTPSNKIAALGFCFGGMTVLELARSGENFSAGIVLHGALSKSALPTHPIKTKLMVLQGFKDPLSKPEALSEFAQEMSEAGMPDWVFTFFSHAKHSYTDPHVGKMDPKKEQEMGREYNQLAAERAFRYSLDFLGELV